MLFCTLIRILTSLIRGFCTSDRNFAYTFFQIPPHDGHPWFWLVVGHCDYNPHNRLSLSRYMPCPAYKKAMNQNHRFSFLPIKCLVQYKYEFCTLHLNHTNPWHRVQTIQIEKLNLKHFFLLLLVL